MLRGLEGRRIALIAEPGNQSAEIRKELIAAGAEVNELGTNAPPDQWHSGMYAALVLAGHPNGATDARVAQLIREFMVAEKPVAAFDVDVDAWRLDATLLAVRGSGDARAFARQVAGEFAESLEEHALDEMSDESFPASDPPAVNPGIAGRPSPDRDARP